MYMKSEMLKASWFCTTGVIYSPSPLGGRGMQTDDTLKLEEEEKEEVVEEEEKVGNGHRMAPTK